MPKINAKNYYSVNGYLSNSKIGDWLRDPYYFYQKHVLGTIPNKQTAAMLIGNAVDEWLTGSRKRFEKKYVCIKDIRKEKLPEGKIRLTEAQYVETVAICEAVERTTAHKQLKKHKKQVILQIDRKDFGIWKGLQGKPDWYFVCPDGTCIITDLKTSAAFYDVPKYERHAYDFGYFRQAAFYQMLLEWLHPEITKFVSRHLVVMKEEDIYPVKTFILNQNVLEEEKQIIMQYIEEIVYTKKFKKSDTTWEDAEPLG